MPIMAKAPKPPILLSEEQRAETYGHLELLHSMLEKGVSQAQIARTYQLFKSMVQCRVA